MFIELDFRFTKHTMQQREQHRVKKIRNIVKRKIVKTPKSMQNVSNRRPMDSKTLAFYSSPPQYSANGVLAEIWSIHISGCRALTPKRNFCQRGITASAFHSEIWISDFTPLLCFVHNRKTQKFTQIKTRPFFLPLNRYSHRSQLVFYILY